jgi:hypothetical protein
MDVAPAVGSFASSAAGVAGGAGPPESEAHELVTVARSIASASRRVSLT